MPKGAPDWLSTLVVSTPNGTTSNAMVAADLAHVVWAVNMGCLGFHVWPSTAMDPAHADELRIDLDPQPGVGFDQVRETALVVKDTFDGLGMLAFVKTSGSRGLHIYVRLAPMWDSYTVRLAAVALARELERRHPELVTAAWWKEERGERVFVDFNQNAPHKTVFGAWSVRPRVAGQVSTPIRWSDVETVVPDDLTLATVPDLLAEQGDAWATIDDDLQRPRAAARVARARHRDGADGRAVAARLPEDAQRATEGCPESSQEAPIVTLGQEHAVR